MRNAWIAGMAMAAMLLAACGGGGGAAAPVPGGTADLTGVVEGYITQADLDRGVSAAGDGIGGVEVWCEAAGTGLRLGQDTTDETGHYRISGLPVETQLQLRFQYEYQSQASAGGGADNGNGEDGMGMHGDGTGTGSAGGDVICVEGEQQIRLQVQERLRIDTGVCEQDTDGDGTPDDAVCNNAQMQVRLRTRAQDAA